MADKRELQIQILGELKDYSEKIIPGVETVIKEYREGRKEDSEEMFNLVIQGINWVIEVFNNCEDIINGDAQRVDKAKMAQAVARLGKVLQEKDDIKLAAALEVDFLPFLNSMKSAANDILS